jgi:nucleotide-binding universal stress UspA family protein
MFKTIVWATDGSEHADSALTLVSELAQIHGSEVVAIHIEERFRGGRFGASPVFADEDELLVKVATQIEELEKLGITARIEHVTTERHDTSALIAEAAASVEAGLIVVGTRGHGELEAMLLGSVARGLTHDSLCPVLVVPPRAPARAPTSREPEQLHVSVGLGV